MSRRHDPCPRAYPRSFRSVSEAYHRSRANPRPHQLGYSQLDWLAVWDMLIERALVHEGRAVRLDKLRGSLKDLLLKRQ